MKKTLTIIVFMFISSSTMAGPRSPRLDSMWVSVCANLNLPTSGTRNITSAVGYRYINEAYASVCVDFPAIEKLDTVTLVGGSEGGALNTDFDRVVSVDRMVDSTVRIPLQPVSQDTLSMMVKTADDASVRMVKNDYTSPRYYKIFNKMLITQPKYSLATSSLFLVKYYAIGARLTSASDSVLCDQRYIEQIINHACAGISLGYMRNPALAKTFQDQYDAAMATEQRNDVPRGTQ